jgi:hypothetical protein
VAQALASVCLALPQAPARQLFDFVFNPASYLHSDRAALHVPAKLQSMGLSAPRLSQALMPHLGLSDDVALDLHDTAHRAALLPLAALEKLALRLSMSQQSLRMRQVILRAELEPLQQLFTPQDWDFVFSHPHLPASGEVTQLLDSIPQADWPKRMTQWGWRMLEAACSVLPPSVGKRCVLKLPVVSGPLHAEPEVACAMVRAIYPALVAQLHPQWEADWSGAFTVS